MDISSSGESPFVVAARTCETRATHCVSTRTEARPAFPRARCEFARILNTIEMQSINGASLRVLDSSIERIVLKAFES